MRDTAQRLVEELMLVSVCVAGPGAEALGDALAQAGTAVEILGDADPGQGFDVAVLMAHSTDAPAARPVVERLAAASERILFVPLPLGQPGPVPQAAMASLAQWFELLADQGYQPVVEFDAGFLSAGAFLVDRQATAAEGELQAFTDRLQHGASPEESRVRALEQETAAAAAAQDGLREALSLREHDAAEARAALAAAQAELAALRAQLAALAASAAAAEARLAEVTADNSAWDGLRAWVRAEAAQPGRDTLDALARDWPALMALRQQAGAAPLPLPVPARPPSAKPGFFRALLRRAAPAPAPAPPPLLAECALIRASEQFDAAWYIASCPDVAGLDPVFHYRLVGALRGADPGPWFESAAYTARHPDAAECPLLHALRAG